MKNSTDYRSRFRILKGGKIALVISAMIVATISFAAPSGESIQSGSIIINRDIPNTTNINQSTNKGIINWQNFDVSKNETVNFNMPNSSSSTLNRVLSNNPSKIYGQINSNGQVFLVNQNGIYFGKNSKVNTAGFTASTLDIKNNNFLNKKYTFEGTSNASILNLGTISSNNAYTALLAKKVINEGLIQAKLGNVQLASGQMISFNINGNSLVKLIIDKGTLNSLVQNKGLIQANGGVVYLTTQALDTVLSGVVNNSGIIEANSIEQKNGKIILFAHGGTANISGTLKAKDGFIETSGKELHVEASTTVKAHTWLLDPTNLVVKSTGGTDLSGSSVSATAIQNALVGTNVELQADQDITVNENITWSEATKLTLKAGDEVYVNAVIENTNITNGGVYFNALNTTNKVIFGADGKVIINNVYQLQWVNTALNGKYELGSNVDATAAATWNGGKGFDPLGNNTTGFTGTFDGKNHTISKLFINRPSTDYVGLFGYTNTGTTISNLGLINVNIFGQNYVGGLVGEDYQGTISNSYSTGSVNGDSNVGGLVGKTYEGTILNSYSTGSVSGAINVGGLVGFSKKGTISNSYSLGSVSGVTERVGGLVGLNNGEISNSYSMVNVSGTAKSVGGLVGINYGDGTITNSYSTGAVSGSMWVGGLVGSNFGTISNSFWDTQTSGQASSAGGTGLTTAQMKDTKTFYDAGWDFDTIWGRDTNNVQNGGYLDLRALNSDFTFNTVLALTVANQSKVYDGTANVTTTLSKANIIDKVTAFTKNVGSNTFTSNLADYGLTYATGFNSGNTETLVYNSGNAEITPKALSFSANNKTYDGTTTAIATLSGIITGDTVSNTSTASFDNKNAGTAKIVTLNSVTLTGTDKDNYTIIAGQTTTADISKKALNFLANNKTYDGTNTASTSLNGIITGDTVSSTIASIFDNKNAGKAKIVTLNSVTLTGTDKDNYSIATGQTTTADIINPYYKNIVNKVLRNTNNKEIKDILGRNDNLLVLLEDTPIDKYGIKLELIPRHFITLSNAGLHLPDSLSRDINK